MPVRTSGSTGVSGWRIRQGIFCRSAPSTRRSPSRTRHRADGPGPPAERRERVLRRAPGFQPQGPLRRRFLWLHSGREANSEAGNHDLASAVSVARAGSSVVSWSMCQQRRWLRIGTWPEPQHRQRVASENAKDAATCSGTALAPRCRVARLRERWSVVRPSKQMDSTEARRAPADGRESRSCESPDARGRQRGPDPAQHGPSARFWQGLLTNPRAAVLNRRRCLLRRYLLRQSPRQHQAPRPVRRAAQSPVRRPTRPGWLSASGSWRPRGKRPITA